MALLAELFFSWSLLRQKFGHIIKNQAVIYKNKYIPTLKRLFFILVVLILSSYGEIYGQQKIVEKFPLNKLYRPFYQVKKLRLNDREASPGLLRPQVRLSFFTPLADNYYISHLSFFCRQELQIEKSLHISLRFRLGSLQYTDYLEQKPNAMNR